VTEELESVTVATDVASLYRGTSIQERVRDHNLRFQEWIQAAIPSPPFAR